MRNKKLVLLLISFCLLTSMITSALTLAKYVKNIDVATINLTVEASGKNNQTDNL